MFRSKRFSFNLKIHIIWIFTKFYVKMKYYGFINALVKLNGRKTI